MVSRPARLAVGSPSLIRDPTVGQFVGRQRDQQDRDEDDQADPVDIPEPEQGEVHPTAHAFFSTIRRAASSS